MKRESRREHNPIHSSSDGALEKADRLAPPEERGKKDAGRAAAAATENDGVLTVNTGELKLPADFTEKEEGRVRLFGLEPIALIILVFSLAFIALITYLIASEPPK